MRPGRAWVLGVLACAGGALCAAAAIPQAGARVADAGGASEPAPGAIEAAPADRGRAGNRAGNRAAKARRIVSMNLCTDQLLLQMVAPERIRAVTYLARDPRSSTMAGTARLVPETTGAAEQVIAMRPDLVLAGTFSTRETVAILRRLGYRVVEFAPEQSLADIRANIAKLAEAVGEVGRGQEMIAKIDRALAGLPEPRPGPSPLYTDYQANGFVSGEGALITHLAKLAGFETLGQRLGISGARQISLEQLLESRPDVVDMGDAQAAPALAQEVFGHRALQNMLAHRRVIHLPDRQTACGTLHTIEALRRLVALRESLA